MTTVSLGATKSGKSPRTTKLSLSSMSSRASKTDSSTGARSSPRGQAPRPSGAIRPHKHDPVHVTTRDSASAQDISIEDACKALLGPVVWRKLRRDLRCAILANLSYEDALDRLGKDKPAHNLFRRADLTEMLASMMHYRRLDVTPWAHYVPEVFFIRAGPLLESLQTEKKLPEKWPALDDHVQDLFETLPVSELSDDEDIDSNYDDAEASASDNDPNGGSDSSQRSPLDDYAKASSRTLRTSVTSTDHRESPRKRSKRLADTSADSRGTKKLRTLKTKRRPTVLACKEYSTLTVEDLQVIEEANPREHSSFRYFGILMQFYGTQTATEQTLGFPNYQPQRTESSNLADRWDLDDYLLMRTSPSICRR